MCVCVCVVKRENKREFLSVSVVVYVCVHAHECVDYCNDHPCVTLVCCSRSMKPQSYTNSPQISSLRKV